MYAYIKGILAEVKPTYVVVESYGIGYKIFTPVQALPEIGSEVKVHTTLVIRENSQSLYGFIRPEERTIFEVLLDISGVGPKLALSLIGHMSLTALQDAIQTEDTAVLKRVPGVGKKSAERLIIELRDKLPALFPRDIETVAAKPVSPLIQDAMSALVNLGYTQSQAEKALRKVLDQEGESLPLSDLITMTLKSI